MEVLDHFPCLAKSWIVCNNFDDCKISVLSWCWHFAGTAKGLEIHLRVLQQQSRIRFPSHKRRGDAGRCKDQ
jgi:hypothetical protein